jgi:DNA processing protein
MTTAFTCSEELRYWLALHRAPLIGSRRFGRLLEHFGSAEAVFRAGRAQWAALRIPDKTIAYFTTPNWTVVDADLAWLSGKGRHCLRVNQPDYPPQLAEIPDPPAILFVIGEPDLLAMPQIAMVGSRSPTPMGQKTAREFAFALVASGVGIVSGLALGIDAASHRGALDGGGITLAVAGTGPDRIYPRQHETLADEIIACGGALISEYPPGTGPVAANFPRRNRIISGLALGTLVVEAAPRSGSLITARLAAEQGRDVFAVPGSIYSPLSRGCNELIREGAKLVQAPVDVIEDYPMLGHVAVSATPELAGADGNGGASGLLKFIAYDPTTVDTLVAATGLSAESIASELLVLELAGAITSMPGGCYIRSH